MERKHPKRKKDQQNNYILEISDNNRYILTFIDGEGVNQTIDINQQLYDLFNTFELEDISYMNKVSRHYEHSELTEQSLNSRALVENISVEDEVINNITIDELRRAIDSLSDIQKRRVIMYYFYNMTYEQIACFDVCSKSAVEHSIICALNKLRRYITN